MGINEISRGKNRKNKKIGRIKTSGKRIETLKIMKTFEVEGWYRYSGDEKDYIIETIKVESSIDALIKFKDLYPKKHFFNIIVKEIR